MESCSRSRRRPWAHRARRSALNVNVLIILKQTPLSPREPIAAPPWTAQSSSNTPLSIFLFFFFWEGEIVCDRLIMEIFFKCCVSSASPRRSADYFSFTPSLRLKTISPEYFCRQFGSFSLSCLRRFELNRCPSNQGEKATCRHTWTDFCRFKYQKIYIYI